MQNRMQRPAAPTAAVARAGAAYGNGFVGSGSWSLGSCLGAPTTDHKAMRPGRPEVDPC